MNIVRVQHLLKYSTFLLTLLGSSLLLTACGGGSSNNSSSSSSISSSSSSHSFSSATVTPPNDGTWPNVKVSANGTKTLNFEWTAVSGATHYKLLKKADNNSDYVQVGNDFTTTTATDSVSVHLTDWVNSRYKVQACDDTSCQDSTPIITDSAMLSAITYVKASNTDAGDWFGWSVSISGDGNTMAIGAPAESSNATGVNGDQTSNTSPTSGAVYVFIKVNGSWLQEAYLKASNTQQPNDNPFLTLPNVRFGYHVSLSEDGNTLAISAINENSPSYGINCNQDNQVESYTIYDSSSSASSIVSGAYPYNSGAIYIFNRNNSSWAQTSYIKPSQELYNTQGYKLNFGYSFVLSGDGKTLAVGNQSDSAYILSSSSSSSSSVQCLQYNLSSTSDSSTSSISSSSSSSNTSSSNSSVMIYGGTSSGAVYIFKLTDSGWQQSKTVKASDAVPDDNFGTSLALSFDGETLAVGATGAEETVTNSSSSSVKATLTLEVSNTNYSAALNSGAVYLFKYVNDDWQQTSRIIPSNQGWDQEFGAAIALSRDGKTLAISTPNDWSLAVGTTGSATDYTYEAGLSYDSTYGYFIVPSANIARVKSSFGSGAVYTYKYSDDTNMWVQEGYLKASNPQTAYQFGSSLALSGNGDVLAVGSYVESSLATGINGDQADTSSLQSGAAYIFKRVNSTWTQMSYVKAPNSDAEDRFAHALSLDFTGETLLIGAHRESSKAVGINGDETDNSAAAAGAAYIY